MIYVLFVGILLKPNLVPVKTKIIHPMINLAC